MNGTQTNHQSWTCWNDTFPCTLIWSTRYANKYILYWTEKQSENWNEISLWSEGLNYAGKEICYAADVTSHFNVIVVNPLLKGMKTTTLLLFSHFFERMSLVHCIMRHNIWCCHLNRVKDRLTCRLNATLRTSSAKWILFSTLN